MLCKELHKSFLYFHRGLWCNLQCIHVSTLLTSLFLHNSQLTITKKHQQKICCLPALTLKAVAYAARNNTGRLSGDSSLKVSASFLWEQVKLLCFTAYQVLQKISRLAWFSQILKTKHCDIMKLVWALLATHQLLSYCTCSQKLLLCKKLCILRVASRK